MAVQTLFPKGAILDIRDASKVNYFAAGKGKFDLQSFYKSRYGPFHCICGIFTICFQMTFYTVV